MAAWVKGRFMAGRLLDRGGRADGGVTIATVGEGRAPDPWTDAADPTSADVHRRLGWRPTVAGEPRHRARRLPAMQASPRSPRFGAGLVLMILLLAACSAAAAPSSSAPPPDTSPDAPVSAPPSDGSGGGTDPGGIGDGGALVVPKPGQLDVHDVAIDELQARVQGSSIFVTASWTSGVEPCNVLDQIVVTEGAGSYAITLREGHGAGDVVCIEIAMTKRTEFEIPNVKPGTHQITDATGRAAPIEVTVG